MFPRPFAPSRLTLAAAVVALSLVAAAPSALAQMDDSSLSPMTYSQAFANARKAERAFLQGHITTSFNPPILTIPNQPFTAHRTYTEWIPGGSPDTPAVTTTVSIARDREGRIHSETSRKPGEVDVIIIDPVDHVRYSYKITATPEDAPKAEACSVPLLRDSVRGAGGRGVLDRTIIDQNVADLPAVQSTQLGKENLEKKDIEGVTAYGERITLHRSSEQGDVTEVTEHWFSFDLGLNLLDSLTDTARNSHSVRTHDVQITDPDEALFHVPATYSVPTELSACGPLQRQ